MRIAITTMIHLCIVFSFAHSEDEVVVKPIEPVALFKGSVDEGFIDPPADRLSLAAGLIDQEKLEQIWKRWKVGAEMPKVDFEKQFVVTTTWGGSRQDVHWMVLPDGSFFFGGGGTKDIKPGFRYHIGVFNWEGVKSVNGVRNPALKEEGSEKRESDSRAKAEAG